jgi:hypothetical protein
MVSVCGSIHVHVAACAVVVWLYRPGVETATQTAGVQVLVLFGPRVYRTTSFTFCRAHVPAPTHPQGPLTSSVDRGIVCWYMQTDQLQIGVMCGLLNCVSLLAVLASSMPPIHTIVACAQHTSPPPPHTHTQSIKVRNMLKLFGKATPPSIHVCVTTQHTSTPHVSNM